ncbi:MAG: hypothetical protein WAV05_07970 [Anaerolineales bacterium]
MFSLKGKWFFCVFSLLIISLLASCSSPSLNSSRGIYPVDPAFADFYRQFGGENTLGPAISPSFEKDGVTYQYIVSGLVSYEPNQIPLKRFRFSPIASVEWHIDGLVEPNPQDTELRYINGHQIWEEIISFCDQYGADIIGLPVTGVSANDAKQRYEQYFEGVGFYRKYTDPPGQVHLMPYGVWMCENNCQYSVSDSTPPVASYTRDNSATEQLFLQASERLGYGFSGAPLASPRLGSDGNYEMVFENVVMFLDPADTNQIKLRPLPSWLGIQADVPGPAIQMDGVSFYQTGEGTGFNIPELFSGHITEHGGFDVTGNPITEYRNLSDGGYSQCFTNLCLEYHPTAPKALQIRPHMLGSEYLSIGANASTSGTSFPEALQINAWEDEPLISSGQSQGINIEARQNNAPVRGIEFSLLVKQPNGITKTYTLPPTGKDGMTHVALDPINGPNGAIVQYDVCVIGAVSPQVCFSRSYTIWDQ